MAEYIEYVNAIVWGPPMLLLLGMTGLFLTVGLRFQTFRKIKYAFSLLFHSRDKNKNEGDISPFNALMTALSATVGTGNIAGVATAIALGGPGAIFYMWIMALVGMATKYAEAVCAVTFREVDATGKHVGGPMYYLKNGVGQKRPRLGKVLAIAFAFLGAAAAFGIGNATQVHSISDILSITFSIPPILTGVVIAFLIGFILLGGITRIANVAGKLVPIMIILYIGAAVLVVLINIREIPAAFYLIISSAFNPVAAAGGFAGAGVAAAIRFGASRGVFSNEAGLGSAAIAHAAAATKDPVRQGHIAMLGTFIDTIIICTLTALCIITSGVWQSGESGAALTSMAFSHSILGGHYVVTFALPILAFTTILGWSYYGERCWSYLFGERFILLYRMVWVVCIVWFSTYKIDFVWNFSDTMNGLMAVPNLIGLLLLSPIVFKATKTYWLKSNKA